MKHAFLTTLLLGLSVHAATALQPGASVVVRAPLRPALGIQDPRDIMKRVNQWQLAHPWKESDRNWIRATWYTGVMAAYAATKDQDYLEQAIRWGNEHQWQPGTEQSGANVLTCTQTYLELYLWRTNRIWIEPTLEWVNSGRSNSPSGGGIWYLEDGRRYVDSLYVGAPPLAMLAKITGDRNYVLHMNRFFWDVNRELFDADAGLFYRDKRFIGQRTAEFSG